MNIKNLLTNYLKVNRLVRNESKSALEKDN
jgi:hypothetical protein